MLPDFEKGLEGAVAGTTVTFPVAFPVDYGQPTLAGKTAEFTAKVHEVAEEVLPVIDDEFCLAFGVAEGGVAQLRSEVEENMRRELEGTVKGRLKNQLFEAVLAANPIEIPQAALESQIQRLQVDWLRRMGVTPEQIKEAPPRDPFEATARRRVALGILIDEIAKAGKMTPQAQKVEEHIETAAMGYPDPEDAARQIRDNAQLMSQVHASVIEEQVAEWLLARAKVTGTPATFKEVMNFGA